MTQIGKYQVVEKIGEGAMGVVYRAMDPVLNRPVAIKIMSEGLAQDDHLRARFLREAQAAGSLQHPNVVTIYDFGEIDGHLFIAMEYIEGIDLERLLQQGTQLPLSTKLDIVIDVLNGLSYAHRRNIIHRDIKPANVRLDEDGHARIMDFGVAHLGASNLTATGMMVGTPSYMAPEQIAGDAVTPSADIFSVGAMLYELLTNAKPFVGDTLHSVLFKIVSDTPAPIETIVPDLPPELSEIVNKALAKSPAQRYQSATDMANALLAVRSRLGGPRLSKTVSQRISIDSALEQQRAKQGRPASRRPLVIAGGAVAALGVALAATLLVRGLTARGEAKHVVSLQTTGVAAAGASAARAPAAESVAAAGPASASQPALVHPDASQRMREPQRVQRGAAAPAGGRDAPPVTGRTATRPSATDSSRGQPARAPAPSVVSSVATSARNAAPDTATRQPVTTPAGSAVTPAVPPAPVAPAENARDAIGAVVAAYAAAIGSRDVAAIRRVYPQLTTEQQANWQAFFGAVRSIAAKFDITSLEVNGTSAVAQLTGVYEYVSSAGHTERQPIAVRVTLQRETGGWKILSIR